MEIENLTNLERNAKIENNTECFTSIGRSKQEDNVQEDFLKEKLNHLNGLDA